MLAFHVNGIPRILSSSSRSTISSCSFPSDFAFHIVSLASFPTGTYPPSFNSSTFSFSILSGSSLVSSYPNTCSKYPISLTAYHYKLTLMHICVSTTFSFSSLLFSFHYSFSRCTFLGLDLPHTLQVGNTSFGAFCSHNVFRSLGSRPLYHMSV